MSLPIPTTLSTGFAIANGSAYRQTTDQLLVVDSSAGTISAVNPHSHVKAAWLGLQRAARHCPQH